MGGGCLKPPPKRHFAILNRSTGGYLQTYVFCHLQNRSYMETTDRYDPKMLHRQ